MFSNIISLLFNFLVTNPQEKYDTYNYEGKQISSLNENSKLEVKMIFRNEFLPN
jgi:hypothetical protein